MNQQQKTRKFNKRESEMVIRVRNVFALHLAKAGLHSAPMPSGDEIIAAIKGDEYTAPAPSPELDALAESLIGN